MKIVHDLLLSAISGETEAEKKYALFGEQARTENLSGIAAMFAALSRAEAIHTANHTRALKKCGYTQPVRFDVKSCSVGTTLANLQAALDGEYEEMKRMYPSFRRQITRAHGDDFFAKVALLSMKWAQDSEREHFRLLKAAHESLQRGNRETAGDYYLCRVCGNVVLAAQPPDSLCPICGHDHSFYQHIAGSSPVD